MGRKKERNVGKKSICVTRRHVPCPLGSFLLQILIVQSERHGQGLEYWLSPNVCSRFTHAVLVLWTPHVFFSVFLNRSFVVPWLSGLFECYRVRRKLQNFRQPIVPSSAWYSRASFLSSFASHVIHMFHTPSHLRYPDLLPLSTYSSTAT
jgi:hypothetical protein